jgi:hypothetical protein
MRRSRSDEQPLEQQQNYVRYIYVSLSLSRCAGRNFYDTVKNFYSRLRRVSLIYECATAMSDDSKDYCMESKAASGNHSLNIFLLSV